MCNTESWVWPEDEAIELPQASYFMLQANAQSTCTNCKHWIEVKPFKPVQHLLSSMTSITVLRANDVSAHPIYSLHAIHRGTAKVQLLHSLHLLVVSLR